jgi:threonine/homoserine/homoserine lactone efflux protein
MQELTAIFGITAALALGAASPGPSFLVVARLAVSSSRGDGLYAALGMGVGGLIFACLSLLGLHGLLLAVPSLYAVLKVLGGLYLAYLGIQMWRGASSRLSGSQIGPSISVQPATRSFVLGLATQISNPKTAIVYASVFAAFLPVAPTIAFDLCVAALVFLIEAGWYAFVAVALSSERPRDMYLRYKKLIDRTAGGVMVGLGLRLITSSRA